MKIAVAYENGEIFQHFGKTEAFKLYDIEDKKVVATEVVSSEGYGHEAAAGFLADKGVNVVICGGLGSGALIALCNAGIEVMSGAEGSADAAVEAFLRNELVSAGVNCDHHEHEEAEEDGCGGDCGGGCGGDCGGCHGCHSEPLFEGKNVGKTCKTHYRGTLNDGTEFDSSYGRGEPLEFVCGMGQMIYGYDKAVADMEVGQSIDIHLMPEEAYGEVNPAMIFTAEIKELPGAEDVSVGDRVYLYDNTGRPVPVTVIGKDDVMITFDANHEMAGKELNFHIELVDVQ